MEGQGNQRSIPIIFALYLRRDTGPFPNFLVLCLPGDTCRIPNFLVLCLPGDTCPFPTFLALCLPGDTLYNSGKLLIYKMLRILRSAQNALTGFRSTFRVELVKPCALSRGTTIFFAWPLPGKVVFSGGCERCLFGEGGHPIHEEIGGGVIV